METVAMPALGFRQEVRPADRDAVRRILESSNYFYPYEIQVATELVDERVNRGLVSGYYFIFADAGAGETVGFTCFGPIACTVSSYDLHWIAVHQAQRGRGPGALLLSETEKLVMALGGTRLYAETSGRALYEPTRKFYRKHGYAEDAVLRDFYGPGDDKVVFRKLLPVKAIIPEQVRAPAADAVVDRVAV